MPTITVKLKCAGSTNLLITAKYEYCYKCIHFKINKCELNHNDKE
jgi:hypothetical protein